MCTGARRNSNADIGRTCVAVGIHAVAANIYTCGCV